MKDKYEISLWEDYLVPASATVPAHYEERKLGIIGSDSITAPCRAFEPKLVENINGTHTLTFKMYYTFKENNLEDIIHQFTTELDQDLKDSNSYNLVWKEMEFNGESYQNPFLSLLVNERKVKAFWKGEWYDLVIKNCQEDSSGKSITYTCTDLYINELSKTGFDIVLDAELNNNSGTATELAQTVLEETYWHLDADGSDTVRQEKEETVYEVYTARSWSVTDETTGTSATIPTNSKILVFYNEIQDFLDSGTVQKNMYTQFAYAPTYECDTNTQRVINAHCYSTTVTWVKTQHEGVNCIQFGTGSTVYGYVYYSNGVSNNYRASRLVKSQLNKFDSLTGKYCNVWKATRNGTGDYAGAISTNDLIYEYKTTEWNDALVVNNLVINSKDFITTEGWLGDSNLAFQLYPPYTSSTNISTYSAKSYLKLTSGVNFYNAGIRQSSSYLPNGFSIGETFIFRYKARANSGNSPAETYISSGITPTICTYKDSGEQKIIDTSGSTYFNVTALPAQDGWNEFRLTCKKSATRNDFYDKKIGLFLKVTTTCWLEEVQLFQEIYGVGTQRINPGDIDVQSVSTIKYVYYNYTKSAGLLSADDVMPLWSSKDDWNYDGMIALYNENFEKIRSIDAKQSNRFNLLQTIAETFECWVQFQINHDSTGRTIYNVDGTPQKYVRFKQEIGQQTGIGFIYGIDLKTISRTIQSDQIVTKTIVSANNNQFAKNGFCTISRSEENYPRSTFLLNFDYYINQGLINGGILNNDLYDSTGDIGYFYWLNKYNIEYDSLTEEIAAKQTELTKQLSYQTVYEGTITSLQESIQNIRAELINMAGVSTWSAATSYIKANASATAILSRMTAIQTQEASLASYSEMKVKLDNSIVALQNLITSHTERQEELLTLIKALDFKFYKKYSRFIQEGSWTNENYIDDNLYYLDAQSIAYTSSRPQISYNISVLRISGIEGFENKVFHLGDIAFIQDTEFFGYTYINGVKTPYKEKVLVSEITSYFDEPDKDIFKIQNYKTQFEDLFQRITSTTQALQYASGEYARAAATVETNGTINPETLQNSIALNEQLVYSAQNEAVVTDSTGLTVTDTTNPNKKTKLTSGGIFITTDGGATWKNAVRGEGIATQYLTTGSINTSSINIMDGSFKAFRWDESGINAYYQLPNDGGINLSKFVRFDHYGIYGIDIGSGEGNYTPESEDDIWDDAKFGMTWKGFFVKNKYGTHYVEVSSENDIQVVKGNIPVIKIGQLDAGKDIYGIRISNASGAPVMETNNLGALWLRNRLNISSTDENFSIGIGYLDGTKQVLGAEIHEVFNANDKFMVYEDGSMKATDGEFTGTIYATGGKIGNMTIDEVEQSVYKVIIESSNGTIFKNGQGSKTLTAKLYEGDSEVTTGTFTYMWFKNNVQQQQTTKQITVTADSTDAVYTYTCRITYTPAQS